MSFHLRINRAFHEENLRRKEAGEPRLTKTHLWKAAEVTSAAATHWFNGDNAADLDTCAKIAPLLRVSAQWLFDGSEPKVALQYDDMEIYETRRNNLRRLIDEKANGNMAEFGRLIGRERSQIKQYLSSDYNEGRSIGERVARYIEEKTGAPSRMLDEEVVATFQAPRVPSADQAVFALLDVQAACGNGIAASDHPEVVSMMSMPIGMAQTLLGTTNKTGAVKIVSAANDSMAPTIEPDDLLFVDTSTLEYMTEGVYLLVHDGHLICKRLSRPGKDIIVSSDNPHYKSWNWNDRPEQTRIVGRVLRALPIQFKKFSGD